jgi:hypothetical protein
MYKNVKEKNVFHVKVNLPSQVNGGGVLILKSLPMDMLVIFVFILGWQYTSVILPHHILLHAMRD